MVPVPVLANGKQIGASADGVADLALFYLRVQEILADPKPYDALFNNCEHTVSRVRTGIASSPQLAACVALGLAVVAVYFLLRD